MHWRSRIIPAEKSVFEEPSEKLHCPPYKVLSNRKPHLSYITHAEIGVSAAHAQSHRIGRKSYDISCILVWKFFTVNDFVYHHFRARSHVQLSTTVA